MIEYKIISPSEIETDITVYVQRGINEVQEIAFDQEGSVTIPSAFDLQVDNSEGVFDYVDGVWAGEEITGFVVLVIIDSIIAFTGVVEDQENTVGAATIKVRSVIQRLLEVGVNDVSFSGTPSAFIKYLFTSGKVTLSGVLYDAVAFDVLTEAQEEQSLSIDVDIAVDDDLKFTDILTEVYNQTGMQIYSNRGILAPVQFGGTNSFASAGYGYEFNNDKVIASSVRWKRPVLWQKTKAIVPYNNMGTPVFVSKTIADANPVDGPTILAQFQEKIFRADGLDGKIRHTTLDSANQALQNILGWRGVPRHVFDFEVSIVDQINRASILALPLFSKAKLFFSWGYVIGVVTKKALLEDRAGVQLYSFTAPVFVHPVKRLWPQVYKNPPGYTLKNWCDFNLYVEFFDEETETVTPTVMQPLDEIHIDEREFFMRSSYGEGLWSGWRLINSSQYTFDDGPGGFDLLSVGAGILLDIDGDNLLL